jgi:parallel beta-helix repeat protein
MKNNILAFLGCILLLIFPSKIFSKTYYIAPNGSDTNDGSATAPFLNLSKAVGIAIAGDIIYVSGGTYSYTSTINITKSGTSSNKISIIALSGQKPVFDFSGQSLGARGIKLTGSYWVIKGIEIRGAGDNGLLIEGGSNNLIENCTFYKNRDSGLQLSKGASNNTIKNCDSYANADPTDYGDADGFACKMDVGSNNLFTGCRAWLNCDDGWDGYLRGTNDVTNYIENSWAFKNGYFENGTDAGANANGNGFKLGGSDDKTLTHNIVIKNSLAFGNKAKGFDQNSNPGSISVLNCTAHNNKGLNFRFEKAPASGKSLIIKNCIAYQPTYNINSAAIQENNSWTLNLTLNDSDFLSILESETLKPRKEDGSLPDIDYMHLNPKSKLIDAGVNIGLPYSGKAPDLGCFEYGLIDTVDSIDTDTLNNDSTFIETFTKSIEIFCYPNPAVNYASIILNGDLNGRCRIELNSIKGTHIKTLINEEIAGYFKNYVIDLHDINHGFYFVKIYLNDQLLKTEKILK